MILEILENTYKSVILDNKFEITKFQLGKTPYKLLKEEIEESINIRIDVEITNHYRDIPIEKHESDDAIMFCLNIKTNKNETT